MRHFFFFGNHDFWAAYRLLQTIGNCAIKKLKLLLHIGIGKTGSTSIQESLLINRGLLLEQAFLYPVGNAPFTRIFLPLLVAGENSFKHEMRQVGLANPSVLQRHRARWMETLSDELDAAAGTAHTCILSSEHLSFLNEEEISRLQDVLFPLFSEVTVIAYLRDPLEYSISMFDTALKVGGLLMRPRPPADLAELDFARLLGKWERAVGRQRLRVRLFDREWLYNSDAVRDFFHLLGVDASQFQPPGQQNKSLDLLGQELMKRINRLQPRFSREGTANQLRGDLPRFMAEHFSGGQRLSPSNEMIAEFDTAFAESNEWVRANFFPDRVNLFPRKGFGATETLQIPDVYLDEMAKSIVELMKRHQLSKRRAASQKL